MFKLTTKPISCDGREYRPVITIEQNPPNVRVAWGIEGLNEVIRRSGTTYESDRIIGDLCEPFVEEALYGYRIEPNYYTSFRQGSITIHTDQVSTFLGQFLPVWEEHCQGLPRYEASIDEFVKALRAQKEAAYPLDNPASVAGDETNGAPSL